MTYELEKDIWTETDFENMGWHDSAVYKLRVAEDLELDIDYIFKWNHPEVEGMPFTFWIAPATLVFKNIGNLTFELDTAYFDSIEIEEIEREVNEDSYNWLIITRQGNIEFKSEGYQQFIRQKPIFQFGQTLSYIERYGFSLKRTTKQENPNLLKQEIVEQRNKDFEHYENAKKRQLKRIEKAQLEHSREKNYIDLKQYLIKKKEIKEQLEFYDYWLKGSRFENY